MAAPLDGAPAGGAAAPRRLLVAPAARRRRLVDRLAAGVVSAGGLAVIASILAILVFLVVEVLPLASASHVLPGRTLALPGPAPVGLVLDPDRTHAATLGDDGVVRVTRLADGATLQERSLAGAATAPAGAAGAAEAAGTTETPGAARAADATEAAGAAPRAAAPSAGASFRALPSAGEPVLAGTSPDGAVLAVRVDWRVSFDGGERRVEAALGEPARLELDPARRPLGAATVRAGDDGVAAAAVLADGQVAFAREVETTSFLTGERTRSAERALLPTPIGVDRLLLDGARRVLYGAAADGRILVWAGLDGAPGAPEVAGDAGLGPVTALQLLIGERSLVVGRESGGLEVWFRVARGEGEERAYRLERVHGFPAHGAPIRLLAPSQRNRTFLALDAAGGLGLYYSTSERVLWTGRTELREASALAFAPKGESAAVAAPGRLALHDVDNPHPEASLGALFGPVWYEGFAGPDHVWQSSSGTDDFEPKLSLTPLLAGTLKGTFYSLLLAIPLGVLGAMYTSQFMHPRLQRIVKPSVELMASLPSVVLGFLAGLWLAPRVEDALPALALLLVVLPLASLAAGAAWSALPRAVRARLAPGSEIAWFAVCLVAAAALCFWAGGHIERAWFAGSFPSWLFERTGLGYDQRNAIVVGIAMGFAVIPIIFAISEDAFSNVPRNLTAGSLALGATRWQTVVRVVLPTASPGIFSAVMVGFGRAVGETMIVLMATGNTPIMDWSPFNGFRTLSANIAVEIPEAPYGGTLYRTLFLAALLLFLLTFAVNTVAEVVRQRLRQRYARL